MSKLQQQTVLRVINQHVRFTIKTKFSFSNEIKEQEFTIEDILRFSEEGKAVWEELNYKDSPNPFYKSWCELAEKIIRGLEECREYKSKTEEDKLGLINTLFEKLSLNKIYCLHDLENKIVRTIELESPIDSDSNFPRYYNFCEKYCAKYNNKGLIDSLDAYINILYDEGNLGEYLNSQYKTSVHAAIYFLKETILDSHCDWNHISDSLIDNLNKTTETKLSLIKSSFNNTRDALNELEEAIHAKENKFNEDVNAAEERLRVLEDTYREKLKLEAPEKLWNDRSKEYQRAMRFNYGVAISVGVLLFVGLAFCDLIIKRLAGLVSWLSPAIILTGFVTLIIYLMRVFIKQAHSNAHLMVACKERAALTRFYQALVYEQKDKTNYISGEERLLIFKSLFTPVDSGLVKTSDTNELETLLATILKRP